MGFKQPRLGPRLLRAAEDPSFFDQVHVLFGGTGAVGGATAFHLISFFEEAASRVPGGMPEGRAPRIVVTGRTHQEVRQFTSLLYGLQQRDHGGRRPQRLPGIGYRTVGGVIVELSVFGVDPSVPELAGFSRKDEPARQAAVAELLEHGGAGPDASDEEKARILAAAVAERVGHPFSDFLRRYLEGGGLDAPQGDDPAAGEASGERATVGLPASQRRFRSVVVGIPLASVATYKLIDLDEAAPYLGIAAGSHRLEELKASYLAAIRDDLATVADELADEVLAAHTTAVGGMYDEEEAGRRTIRIGFAHSALGQKLKDKQLFAERLAELYAEKGIKMLVTAAAIGIDTILVDKVPPINGAVRRSLSHAVDQGLPLVPAADLRSGVIQVYPPAEVGLAGEEHSPLAFEHGSPLRMDYVVKSGENGFFTVADADSLYRVMRVTSSGELGIVLARVAVFGDHPESPLFRDNVCYYTETDNSRQVFDLLAQPPLAATQRSGLSPKSLQDLGSAKHQGEMHTLGLLILLHRLLTLDLEAISHKVDLQRFDPRAFFEENSRALTLERAAGWRAEALAQQLRVLVSAREVDDLSSLKLFFQTDPQRQEAAFRVLQAVIETVWATPSLGCPILFEDAEGQRRVLTGPYAAPLDRVLPHRDSLGSYLGGRFEEVSGRPAADDPEGYERFVELHIANFGFVDLRPVAVLVTARSEEEELAGKVQLFREVEPFRQALAALPPYSYFATSGLLALLTRLSDLNRQAGQLDLRFGTANEHRAHFVFDHLGRPLLIPGLVEAFRMVAEGLGKNTGTDRLDGRWGYGIPAGAARGDD